MTVSGTLHLVTGGLLFLCVTLACLQVRPRLRRLFDGGKSPAYMRHAQAALAAALPNGRRETLEGQTHIIKPKILAPRLAGFFLA